MKSNVIDKFFYTYLNDYIKEITKYTAEFFIAITDIELYELRKLDPSQFSDYKICIIDKESYSEAVKIRNNNQESRIVILSNDSTKQIDSLKDFIEYSIIPKKEDTFWSLIKKVFKVEIEIEEKKYLNVLFNKVPITIFEWLEYLDKCIENGTMDKLKINQYLPVFNLWASESADLKLSKLSRIIRYSDPYLIENKLAKVIVEDSYLEDKKHIIAAYLNEKNIKGIFEKLSYEEIKDFFKGSTRNKSGIKKDDEADETNLYNYSYEMAIRDDNCHDIKLFENSIKVTEDLITSFIGLKDESNNIYDTNLDKYEKDINNIINKIDYLPLPPIRKSKLKDEMCTFLVLFGDVIEKNKETPPAYLYQYCENQKDFIEKYFEILGYFVNDEIIADNSSDIVNTIQNLFCEENEGGITMPYFHPIIGFYFMSLKKSYDEIFTNKEWDWAIDFLMKIVEKEKIKFPIRFLYWNKKLYQLDLHNLNKTNTFIFKSIDKSTSNSLINIKVLQRSIIDYIVRNPYLWEINISIIGLEDVTGIFLLHKNLQESIKNKTIGLSRLVFNIITKKEDVIKTQLLTLNNIFMIDPEVCFKFTYNRYLTKGEFKLNNILLDSDLVFFADTDILYNKEKLDRYKINPNQLKNSFANFDLNRELDNYYFNNDETIEILWDTLHNITINSENVIVKWNNQNFNTQVLIDIKERIQGDELFSGVILSSNKELVRSVYLKDSCETEKSKLTGKDLLILTFSKNKDTLSLSTKNKAGITFSLLSFFKDHFDEDFKELMFEGDDDAELVLNIRFLEGEFKVVYTLVDNSEDNLVSSEKEYHYDRLVKRLLRLVFRTKRPTALKLRALLCNHLYERTYDYQTALMIYHLSKEGMHNETLTFKHEKAKDSNGFNNYKKGTNINEFQDMMTFFEKMKAIDESLISEFRNFYDTQMLGDIISENEKEQFVKNNLINNMKKMYERVGAQNG